MSIESNTYGQWQEGTIDMSTIVQTYPWPYTYPTKSAREQVQDEILMKIAVAIESDDLEKAKELVKLAKAIKEL
jgi:hypothetical protein